MCETMQAIPEVVITEPNTTNEEWKLVNDLAKEGTPDDTNEFHAGELIEYQIPSSKDINGKKVSGFIL